jgi:hypothetical protein
MPYLAAFLGGERDLGAIGRPLGLSPHESGKNGAIHLIGMPIRETCARERTLHSR